MDLCLIKVGTEIMIARRPYSDSQFYRDAVLVRAIPVGNDGGFKTILVPVFAPFSNDPIDVPFKDVVATTPCNDPELCTSYMSVMCEIT